MWITNADIWRKLNHIEGMLFRLQKPTSPRFLVTGERKDGMSKYMQFEVIVAAITSGLDAVVEALDVLVDDTIVLANEYGPGGGVGAFEAKVGANVKATLVYRDDSGNESQPATVEFVVVDKIAPPAPATDTLAFSCVGERVEEDVVPPEPVE